VTYRINYGNGQVHGAWSTLDLAKREYAYQRDYARRHNDPWYGFIQHRVDDEWRRVRLESEES
jgi:hypothetical protein